MNKDSQHPMTAPDPVALAQELALIPVEMATAWWNAMIDRFVPIVPHLHEPQGLCVPPEIDGDAEPALFA